MDSSLRAEIDSCIRELDSIARKLDSIAYDVQKAMIGMNTYQYIYKLENCASKYRAAANKLRKIR